MMTHRRYYWPLTAAGTLALALTAACTTEANSIHDALANDANTLTGDLNNTIGVNPGNPNTQTSVDPNNHGPVTGTVTYYRDVKPIATAKCATCHDAGGIGPFTLTTYNDWFTKMASINSDVSANIMPPWMPDDACNSYEDDLSLTPDQKSTIAAWVQAGGPIGDPNDYVAPPGSTAPAFRADMTLTMPKPFQVKTSPDEYRCFAIPWTATTTKYITGFALKPGNQAIVHHAIVDIVSPSNAASVSAKDGADGSPGWDCGQQGASLNWLAAWAPGSMPRTFGPGDSVGTKLVPGSLLVLQMHYHVVSNPASAAPDQTSFELETVDSVQKEGHFVEILDPAWVAGGMPIAANANDVVHNYSINAALNYLAITQSVPSSKMAVYQVAAHMHQRGSIFNMTITRSGKDQCLLTIPRWNFNWQNGYQLNKPFNLQTSDTVNLNCHWDNTAAHQPVVNGQREIPRNLNWGEGTEDEMCIGFMYMAPQ